MVAKCSAQVRTAGYKLIYTAFCIDAGIYQLSPTAHITVRLLRVGNEMSFARLHPQNLSDGRALLATSKYSGID